mmetsp:Transcript_13570/g.31312  ORF Transcript_13570/g.31312 Transcript_13570/m.31312 type:complete len:381 (-) Transcript_13570:228-1370(-)
MNLPLLLIVVLSTLSVATTAFQPKKILLSFDGTGDSVKKSMPNEGNDRSISNILKLHLLAGGDVNNKRNDVDGQVCLYYRGLGAISNNDLLQKINYGLGILDFQTKPMHKMLNAVYNEGDEIYIIAFSRGAAAARKFVCELDAKGTDVKFLGCFDTVSFQLWKNLSAIVSGVLRGTLINSKVLGEKDGRLPENVGTAVQSVSLDESRSYFPPVYMDSKDPRIFESYFPGVHSNVGGNYYYNGLSDACCKHMQDWLKKEGLTFLDYKDVRTECLEKDDDPNVKLPQECLTIKIKPEDPVKEQKQIPILSGHRKVCCVTNNEIIDGARVNIDQSVLHHLEARANMQSPYEVNPNLKSANFVVTGHLGEELPEETEKLRNLLK